MEHYDSYGGRHFGREEFWSRWCAARAKPAALDLKAVLEGGALVPWKGPATATAGGEEEDAAKQQRQQGGAGARGSGAGRCAQN